MINKFSLDLDNSRVDAILKVKDQAILKLGVSLLGEILQIPSFFHLRINQWEV